MHAIHLTTATGPKWGYRYDDANNPYLPTGLQNPQGTERRFKYDAQGNLEQTGHDEAFTDPYTLEYYLEMPGALKVARDPDDNPTEYFYNAVWELERIDHPGPLGDDNFTYDG